MYRWDAFVHSLTRIEWTDIGIVIAIFVVFLLFRKLFTKYIFKLIIAISKKTPTVVFTNILLAFERPLHVFWVVLGTYLALVSLPFNFMTVVFVEQLYRTIIILLIGWGLYNYMSAQSMLLGRLTRKFEIDEDSMLVPFVSKILRSLVIALIFVVIADEWGYSISGFVAGLGLGGLAFALAAQETIANFFGGVVIITEKPFAKGHWIETPTVEGVVEDIGFRSTQIRTFQDAVVTVPNSTLSKEPITNWSVMKKRRISFSLGVDYRTTREQLGICVGRIESLLKASDEVDQDFMLVRFDEFNESSLDIYLYFFTKTTAWAEWFRVKEDMNFSIMEILEEEGVSIAFPTRSIHFEEDENNESQITQEGSDKN